MSHGATNSFLFRREALSASVPFPVVPPRVANTLMIGNAGSDDLYVYSSQADVERAQHHLIIGVGLWHPIAVPLTSPHLVHGYGFHPAHTACWLKTAIAGDVVLEWF